MREKKIKRIAEIIGKGINVKENGKTVKEKEDKFLHNTIELLCEIEASTNAANAIGVNLFEYEERSLVIIKGLLDKAYGEIKSEIIMWWVFESITHDGKVLPLMDENEKKHIIKTPKQLMRFLKRYDGR
tara:strand:- start:159 stop:545 length:387 start_codon:yes stop_codon:yes gene_type:complete